MAKRKSIKKSTFSNKQNLFLFIQVFQMGAIQVEKNFDLNSFFHKKIKIGHSRFSDLYLPFAPEALDLNIFKVGKGKAEIFLDPRLDGYINTSQKFGEVREFTAPRDALGVLSSIEDPLAISLKAGARGRIRFFGFEIIFKIEIPAKEKIFKDLPIIKKNFLQLPSFDSPIEKHVIPISILAMACIFIPVINWLLNFPSKAFTGLLSVPSEIITEFVAPENIRLLPFVFGDNYVVDSAPQLVLLWVHELQMRWENAEHGKAHHSAIPFLEESKLVLTENKGINLFQEKIKDNYKKIETEKKFSSEKERYYSYLKKSPMLASVVSGQDGESNYHTIARRIQQLSQADSSIIEYLKLEHKILKTHYETSYGAKKLGIVVPPQTGQVIGPQVDPVFFKEFNNYKNAEIFAQMAENSKFRAHLKDYLQQEIEEEKNNNFFYQGSVFLSDQGVIYPYQFMDKKDNMNKEDDYNTLLSNALFSDVYTIPPPPKPKPIIDLKMVQFVVYNKKEEIRSCYNSALRKNIRLNGEIKLSWLIDEAGKPHNIKMVHSSMNDGNLFRCIESRIKSWKFPKSKNGLSTVSFPFKFLHIEKE